MPVLIPAGGQNLQVNGVDLSQYAVILDSLAPLMGAPKRRGENISIPGRHGTLHTPRKRFDQTDLVLKMHVLGAQSDGTVPGGSTAAKELYARADALMDVFGGDTVTLLRTMPDGTQRQAIAEVVDAIDWSRQLGDRPLLGVVTVALVIYGAFWTDLTQTSQTITGATGTSATLTQFAPATAPITDLTITWSGPVTNPQLVHGARYLMYGGALSSGQQLVLTTADWTVGTGSGSAWTPDVRNVSFGPGPEWMSIDPSVSPFTATILHTGGGSASVTIGGYRTYLGA